MTSRPYHLYFHAPCFDGVVSAVLMHDVLVALEGASSITRHGVNYDANPGWSTTAIDLPAAVVDFAYHPLAHVWIDHHSTAFEPSALEGEFQQRRHGLLVFDPHATSCARLIWQRLSTTVPFAPGREPLVEAADRIDSARYDSPQEAVYSDAPAMRISASLAGADAVAHADYLVGELLSQSMDFVADTPPVVARAAAFRVLLDAGLERFKGSARLEPDGIVVFDVDATGVEVSRYAPYLIFPDARYSLGVIRRGDGWRISAMRNPWIEFPSVPLGEVFSRFGGGGHHRVAATRRQPAFPDGLKTRDDLLNAIRAATAAQVVGVPS